MPIKRAGRSATVSFCGNAPFLAAGSVAGAIDLNFSTTSVLEVRALSWAILDGRSPSIIFSCCRPGTTWRFLQVFSLELSSPDHELQLAGAAVQAPERFSRLCWGPAGPDPRIHPVSAR
jgi:protein transport protein SEC31